MLSLLESLKIDAVLAKEIKTFFKKILSNYWPISEPAYGQESKTVSIWILSAVTWKHLLTIQNLQPLSRNALCRAYDICNDNARIDFLKMILTLPIESIEYLCFNMITPPAPSNDPISFIEHLPNLMRLIDITVYLASLEQIKNL